MASNILQLQNGYKQYGPKVLFDSASFAINEGEHIGVIGPNGAGKTTLFKILVGQEHLDAGKISKSNNLKIGYLEQESEWSLEQTSEEYLAENCIKPIWELKQLGNDIGLTESHFSQPLKALSGGYRMRMKLLYLIGQEPNLMLLDEPTNFLDLESILALETFLQNYSGAFLLISHDREFLKRTTEATVEVESGEITKFPGHIDEYFEQKAQLREILEAEAKNIESKRKHLQDFVDRFGAKATKAKQAQSRVKQIEKLKSVDIRELPVKAKIKVPPPVHTGKESLAMLNATLGYGDKVVLKNVNIRLERGAHLGVVGYNGAGKSTLLKSLAGSLPLIAGTRTLGYQVSLAHFSQHSAEQLDLNSNVIESLQSAAHPEIKNQEILNVAGSLLFSGDDLLKKIRTLSGGEKSRVALGQILLKRSPLLLMDEPTNHLDFDTVETLTEALRRYEGTVIVVSHDRSFIGRIATKILEIHDGKVEVYPGTYDDYVWSLQNGALKDRVSEVSYEAPKEIKKEAPKVNSKEDNKRQQKEIKDLQKQIAKLERNLKTLEEKRDKLTQELMTAQGIAAQNVSKEVAYCARDIETIENELMQAMEALELKSVDTN